MSLLDSFLFLQKLLDRQQLAIMMDDVDLEVCADLSSFLQNRNHLLLETHKIKTLIMRDQLAVILVDNFELDGLNKSFYQVI